MRKLLRVEAAGLLKGQAGHQKNFKVRMERIIKRLESDSDGVLLSELAEVRDELAAARRGLARLALAEQPTLKLKNEWHDWVRHAHHSEGVDHEVRSERLEMLASELRLRGVEMPKVELPVSKVASRKSQVAEVRIEPCVEIPMAAEMMEDGESDEVVAQHWDEIGQYWERLIGGLHTEHADPGQLARLFHAFREIQGERKRADRLAGVRRYRLGAFEAWAS
jgi:hypothetical protein